MFNHIDKIVRERIIINHGTIKGGALMKKPTSAAMIIQGDKFTEFLL